ncbi:MAG: hypothetical protein NTX15_04080 [Candidatus Kapabacteria bacterium]|nr:hypothetical protein [Candidatus Kapabacteria bacterium]
MIIMIAGCHSTKYTEFMLNNKAYVVDRPIFELKGVRLGDSTVQLSFMTSSSLRTRDRSIRYVEFYVGPDKDHLNDSIMVNPSIAGNASEGGTVLFIGEGVWDSEAARASKSAVVLVSVITSTDHLMYYQNVEYQKAEPVDLAAFVDVIGDSALELGVTVRRVFVPPGEYLPTSESFRVLISDSKGSVVWRSDAGLAFLSIVTVVEPQNANGVHRYIMPWNGRDLSGQIVPNGEYRVDFIIPSRPKNYISSTSIKWPPR